MSQTPSGSGSRRPDLVANLRFTCDRIRRSRAKLISFLREFNLMDRYSNYRNPRLPVNAEPLSFSTRPSPSSPVAPKKRKRPNKRQRQRGKREEAETLFQPFIPTDWAASESGDDILLPVTNEPHPDDPTISEKTESTIDEETLNQTKRFFQELLEKDPFLLPEQKLLIENSSVPHYEHKYDKRGFKKKYEQPKKIVNDLGFELAVPVDHRETSPFLPPIPKELQELPKDLPPRIHRDLVASMDIPDIAPVHESGPLQPHTIPSAFTDQLDYITFHGPPAMGFLVGEMIANDFQPPSIPEDLVPQAIRSSEGPCSIGDFEDVTRMFGFMNDAPKNHPSNTIYYTPPPELKFPGMADPPGPSTCMFCNVPGRKCPNHG